MISELNVQSVKWVNSACSISQVRGTCDVRCNTWNHYMAQILIVPSPPAPSKKGQCDRWHVMWKVQMCKSHMCGGGRVRCFRAYLPWLSKRLVYSGPFGFSLIQTYRLRHETKDCVKENIFGTVLQRTSCMILESRFVVTVTPFEMQTRWAEQGWCTIRDSKQMLTFVFRFHKSKHKIA